MGPGDLIVRPIEVVGLDICSKGFRLKRNALALSERRRASKPRGLEVQVLVRELVTRDKPIVAEDSVYGAGLPVAGCGSCRRHLALDSNLATPPTGAALSRADKHESVRGSGRTMRGMASAEVHSSTRQRARDVTYPKY